MDFRLESFDVYFYVVGSNALSC